MKVQVGQRFSRLVVIEDLGGGYIRCECDCGVVKSFYRQNVVRQKSKSCGCLSKEKASDRATHGMSKTKVYFVWNRMWSRCTNPKIDRYPRYGGRGITVCERWKRFEAFFEDMGDIPSPGHSIGRIDNDGNYEPGNCRWETKEEQKINTSKTVYLEHHGVRKSLIEWVDGGLLSRDTAYQRINAGMDSERVLEQRNLTKRPITVGGVTKLTTEWMKSVPIPISSFYKCIRAGLTEEEVVRKYQKKSANY